MSSGAEIHFFQKIIIKTILINKKWSLLSMIYSKLFSALSTSSRFYFTDVEGALCFVFDTINKNFKFVIFDLLTYKILLEIDFEDNFDTSYSKCRNNFHCYEIEGGSLGFYFENTEVADSLFTMISKRNKDKDKILADFNEYLANSNLDNFQQISLALQNQKFSLTDTPTTMKNPENVSNFNSIKKTLSFLDSLCYNKLKKCFEFYGKKQIALKMMKEYGIESDLIKIINSDGMEIGTQSHFVNNMINHMIGDYRLKNKTTLLKVKTQEQLKRQKQCRQEKVGEDAESKNSKENEDKTETLPDSQLHSKITQDSSPKVPKEKPRQSLIVSNHISAFRTPVSPSRKYSRDDCENEAKFFHYLKNEELPTKNLKESDKKLEEIIKFQSENKIEENDKVQEEEEDSEDLEFLKEKVKEPPKEESNDKVEKESQTAKSSEPVVPVAPEKKNCFLGELKNIMEKRTGFDFSKFDKPQQSSESNEAKPKFEFPKKGGFDFSKFERKNTGKVEEEPRASEPEIEKKLKPIPEQKEVTPKQETPEEKNPQKEDKIPQPTKDQTEVKIPEHPKEVPKNEDNSNCSEKETNAQETQRNDQEKTEKENLENKDKGEAEEKLQSKKEEENTGSRTSKVEDEGEVKNIHPQGRPQAEVNMRELLTGGVFKREGGFDFSKFDNPRPRTTKDSPKKFDFPKREGKFDFSQFDKKTTQREEKKLDLDSLRKGLKKLEK